MMSAPRRRSRTEFWFGLSFLVLVLAVLFYLCDKIKDFATNAEQLTIHQISLFGELHYTSEEEVRRVVGSVDELSLFLVNIADIKEVLEALPWVDRVNVRREWPNQLRVHFIEQKPIARWQEAGWLNHRAEPFVAPWRDELATLPLLIGPEGSAAKVWQMWQQLSELLQLNGHDALALTLSPRHAWMLELQNGVVLELGRKDTMARVQRFIDVWPQLVGEPRQPEYIDLRYDTGLAVRWQPAERAL